MTHDAGLYVEKLQCLINECINLAEKPLVEYNVKLDTVLYKYNCNKSLFTSLLQNITINLLNCPSGHD